VNEDKELEELGQWLSEPVPSEPAELSLHMEQLAGKAARATALKSHFGEKLRKAKARVLDMGYPSHITLASEKKIYMECMVSSEIKSYEDICGYVGNIHERSITCGSLRKSYVSEKYQRPEG